MCGESGLRQAADLEIQDTGLTWAVLGHTNTEDLRLGRVTFALYTETGSTNFRVEVLGKAYTLRTKGNPPFFGNAANRLSEAPSSSHPPHQPCLVCLPLPLPDSISATVIAHQPAFWNGKLF